MTNRPNDFNFDEDPFGDDNPFNGNGNGNGHDNPPDDFNEFNFDDFDEAPVPEFDFSDDETALPPGLGDNLDSDMPTLEEDLDSGGTSRTFILLALLMVLLFLGGLALVIVLVLRPTGPTDAELTATQVVMLNQTVEAQFAQTQTQAVIFDNMTRTVDAFTDTPTATASPTEATRPPTRTPTVTLDPTELAGTAQAIAFAQTATALAQPSVTALPTNTPTTSAGLAEFFATQVAFATLQGEAQQVFFGTQVAILDNSAATQQAINEAIQATQAAMVNAGGEQEAVATALQETQVAAATGAAQVQETINAADIAIQATQAALDASINDVATAIAEVDTGLGNFALTAAPIATQIAQITPEGLATQAAIGTFVANATVDAQQTQASIATLVAEATTAPETSPEAGVTTEPSGTEVAALSPAVQTAVAFATQYAQELPGLVATQRGAATQVALQTRAALVEQALSGTLIAMQLTPTAPPLSGINLTATAIAEAFQLLTQQAPEVTVDPGIPATVGFPTLVPTPSTLPQTGLFDEMSSGANLGVLALMVLGLVGVVFGARYLRSRSPVSDMESAPDAPEQAPPAIEHHDSPAEVEDSGEE